MAEKQDRQKEAKKINSRSKRHKILEYCIGLTTIAKIKRVFF